MAALTRSRAILMVVIAAIAFSTSAPLARLARPAHPWVVAFGRVAVAAVVLAAFDPRGLAASVRALGGQDRMRVALAGLLLAAHFALFQWGLEETSLPAAVSLVSLEPLAVVVTAWALFGIPPRPLERWAVLVATAGAVVVAQGAGEGEHRVLGDALVLGAVVLFGFYVASARRLRDAIAARHYAPLVYGVAAIVLGAGLPFVPERSDALVWPLPPASAAVIALVGLLPTALGHTLVQTAARTASPSLVAMVSPGETLGSIALGIALLGGTPTWTEAAGGAIILVGAGLAVAAQR